MNNVVSQEDKHGGVQYPRWLVDGFNEVLVETGLNDVNLIGHQFTWERGRGTENWTNVRLDRVLTSNSWLELFPFAKLCNIEGPTSNHSPLLLVPMQMHQSGNQRRFRFENAWLIDPMCEQLTRDSWEASPDGDIHLKVKKCGENMMQVFFSSSPSFPRKIHHPPTVFRGNTTSEIMAGSQGGASRRSSMTKKKASESTTSRKSLTTSRSMGLSGERTVKRLRLSKALTIPETTSVHEACRRMAARRADALLLTDSNALLCGILTDKDIATRVIARELNLEETPVSKVMTRNPVFVISDTLAVVALQKMVQGKFRHLPVVEKGEVIALLDIAKCLYDAIARMERAAEKGKAIAAAVEGVEKHWGGSASGPNTFIETLRERIFKPSLSTILSESSKVVTVTPVDTVLMASKKMLECQSSCAIVTVDEKPQGILTSKDILMRVIALDLPPESTLVEKVMTPNPECATVDTPIVDALHTMHDGKFLHLPVLNGDGIVVDVIDVLHITHAAVTTMGSTAEVNNEAANSMMQKFWDSAMDTNTMDDDETRRFESSLKLLSEVTETGRSVPYPSTTVPTAFAFKIQDRKGRMHRFTCDTRNLTELITAILQRVGDDIDRSNLPQILYEDEDQDQVVLASDSDLVAAVDHAKSAGWKGLKLHLDYSGEPRRRRGSGSGSLDYAQPDAWASAYSTVAAGAALVAGLGVLAFLRRAGN
ncbi:CBS-PB1 domain contining protein [Heracleum sosnowskyi]|uniref:CBS-PB1 domain contining protein n=1 Tax=Heracleum sosnowskyi TaxID=360622 RepID=A0AAD8HZV2_9APIA|nr:CBS-PB1 domain contining protein [Heracleum sosnowskyi]